MRMKPEKADSLSFFDSFDVTATVTSAQNDAKLTVSSLIDSFFGAGEEDEESEEE